MPKLTRNRSTKENADWWDKVKAAGALAPALQYFVSRKGDTLNVFSVQVDGGFGYVIASDMNEALERLGMDERWEGEEVLSITNVGDLWIGGWQ